MSANLCDLLLLAPSKRGYSDVFPDRDRSRGRSRSAERNLPKDHIGNNIDDIKAPDENLATAVLLIALKQPESDLRIVRPILDDAVELVSDMTLT
jgi:hypothetical protein